MTPTDPRLLTALSLALATGLSLTACDPSTPTGPIDPDSDVDSDTDVGTDTVTYNLDEICASDQLLEHVSLASAVDSLHLRRSEFYGDPNGSGQELWSTGTACATATDSSACLAELATTWPDSSGWGYCGEGCSDSGLVTTSGDSVDLYDSTAEVLALFGDIDSPADALFLAVTQEYQPECSSVTRTAEGSWQMTATIMISDCEWVDEVRRIQVTSTGETTVLEVLEVIESGACAGRLPDGIAAVGTICGNAVARHLAHLAWLEGAAVVAFERLAVDLTRHGAPADLVDRARAAALDEVDHASRMGALAATYGVDVPAIDVAPHQDRSLYEIALENAVEGCVRETYGVVDALYRSKQAPSAEIRALFERIAADETRHSALSWDIAAWANQHLSQTEAAAVDVAAKAAHHELMAQLKSERPDAVQLELGAPPSSAAVAMAETLRVQLAA